MAFITNGRYGDSTRHDDDADVEFVILRLLHELETEQFEQPDDEHTQVSVSHGDWGLTACVSGLLILDDGSSITGSPSDIAQASTYLRATNREQVLKLMCELARGKVSQVRSAGWVQHDALPPLSG